MHVCRDVHMARHAHGHGVHAHGVHVHGVHMVCMHVWMCMLGVHEGCSPVTDGSRHTVHREAHGVIQPVLLLSN